MVDFLIRRKYGNAIFVSWCPCGVPKCDFGSFAENGRFLNKPANMEMLFSCPRCTGAHLASQNRNLGALPKNGQFLNKPLIWKCYFPVPAALASSAHLASQNRNLGASPKMVDFLISR